MSRRQDKLVLKRKVYKYIATHIDEMISSVGGGDLFVTAEVAKEVRDEMNRRSGEKTVDVDDGYIQIPLFGE